MQSPPLLGELVVVAIKAENLLEQSTRKQDPFCVFRVNGIVKTTRIDRGGGSYPIWDDQVNIPLSHGQNVLNAQVFDRDMNPNNFMGESNIDLSKVLREREHDGYFPLKLRGQSAGEVYLEMTFYPLNHSKNSMATHAPAYHPAAPSHRPMSHHTMSQHSGTPPANVPSYHLVPLPAAPPHSSMSRPPRPHHPGPHPSPSRQPVPHHLMKPQPTPPHHPSAPHPSLPHHTWAPQHPPHHPPGTPVGAHHPQHPPHHPPGTPVGAHHPQPFPQPRPSGSAQTMTLLSSYRPAPSPNNYSPQMPHHQRPLPPRPHPGPPHPRF